MQSLLQLFPADRRPFWERAFSELEGGLQEIRLRAGKPVMLLIWGEENFLTVTGERTDKGEQSYRASREELEALLNHICHYSLYAYEDELRQGFLTVPGGHRVGVAGQVVQECGGGIRTIKNISCLNIRVAHEIKGAADEILPLVYQEDRVKNVLIISPPGCGKTTLLRDLVRQVSDGSSWGRGKAVSLVDERSEIAGSWQGIPQNDIGVRTDVLDACPKVQGMMLLLRAMSPQVIAIDELGSCEDMEALHGAARCGVSVLATIHGESVKDVLERFGKQGRGPLFDLFLVLGKEEGKPVLRKILRKEEVYASLVGRNHDSVGKYGIGAVVPSAVCPPTEKCSPDAGDTGTFDERNRIWENFSSGVLQKGGNAAAGTIPQQLFADLQTDGGKWRGKFSGNLLPGDGEMFKESSCHRGGQRGISYLCPGTKL